MSARDYALLELDARHLPNWPANLLRGRHRPRPALTDPRDRRLAEQIIIGVIKNLLHLQWLTEHFSKRSLKSIDPLAQKILAMGLYQLRFLTRIPPSAAVDQAVEQARRFGRGRASGFVNAVLRNATRDAAPAEPDRKTDPARYAQLILSHPPELFEKLRNLLGPEDALRFCEHDNLEPPAIVRLFRNVRIESLAMPGISITPHQQPGMYVVDPAPQHVLADWATHGLAQVQDPTSAQVVEHLDLSAGQSILDRCCGLGTKTLQMHDLTAGNSCIVAIDPATQRLDLLRRLLEQRQIRNVSIHAAEMLRDVPDVGSAFDRILIDAPCSNSGVLARRPEARYSQTPQNLASLAALQDRILDDTAPYVSRSGRLIYATCSIWPEENHERVVRFLSKHPQYTLIEERSTLPSFTPEPTAYRDGGHFAVLARS